MKYLYFCGIKNLNDYTNFEGRNIGHAAAAKNQVEIIKFLKYNA